MLQKVLMKTKQIPLNTYVWLGVFVLSASWISFLIVAVQTMIKYVVSE